MTLVFNAKNRDIFLMVQNGSKKIETRAATIKYKKLKVGDTITFSCSGESFERKISKISYYTSVAQLLETYKPKDVNPKINNEEELIAMYNSFPGYEKK